MKTIVKKSLPKKPALDKKSPKKVPPKNQPVSKSPKNLPPFMKGGNAALKGDEAPFPPKKKK